MAGTTAAIIGSSLLGAYASHKAAKSEERAMNKAQAQQQALSEQALQLQQEQMQRFDQIYGGVEKRLADFYSTLDANTLAAPQIARQQEMYKQLQEKLNRQITQRKIDTPASTALQQKLDLQQAERLAAIKNKAELTVPQMQQQFVQSGQRGNPFVSNVANQLNQQANLQGAFAQQHQQNINQANQSFANSIAGGVQAYVSQDQFNKRMKLFNDESGATVR